LKKISTNALFKTIKIKKKNRSPFFLYPQTHFFVQNTMETLLNQSMTIKIHKKKHPKTQNPPETKKKNFSS